MYNADKIYSFHLTEKGIKKYPYYNFEAQESSLAYANIYMIEHHLLKADKYYTTFENYYINKGLDFKESFTKAYYDYYELEERYDNIGPAHYFHQIIEMSNVKIKPDFKIASIDFIKSNVENKGYGKTILNKVEKFLIESGFKQIVIQLLDDNQRLIRFYKKAGYTFLENTKDYGYKCIFMYKNI